MPKSLEQENVTQLAQRLIAELKASRLKKGNNNGLAEFGRSKTSTANSGINTSRLTHNSTA